MTTLEAFAPAKINLYLHVLGKRTDDYHEVESLIVFADIGDTLFAKPASELSLKITGPFSSALTGDISSNLVVKAAKLLQARTGIKEGAEITLVKNLPIASGIGGGSSDAAATLYLLCRLWNLSLSLEALQSLAHPLGADMAACLQQRTVLASGIGEIVKPMPVLSGISLLLVNPSIPLDTQTVFSRIALSDCNSAFVAGSAGQKAQTTVRPDPDMHLGGSKSALQLAEYLRPLRNDLAPVAKQLMPSIEKVLTIISAQSGCQLARMSGSGATCFGLFDSARNAAMAAEKIACEQPKWWCRAGKIL